jgi:hypothetical protein
MARNEKVKLSGSIEDLIAGLESDRKERAERAPSSVAGVIERIYDTLVVMRSDGWSDAEIASSLSTRGITIGVGTLRTYMQRFARERASAPTKRGRPKKDNSSGVDTKTVPDASSQATADSEKDSRDKKKNAHAPKPAAASSPAPSSPGKPPSSAPSMNGFVSRERPSLDA